MLTQTSVLFIGNIRWDPATQTLHTPSSNAESGDSEIKRLTKKQQALLHCLYQVSPAPLSKQDIIRAVWGNDFISAESLPQLINRTRLALNDKEKNLIVNHPGEGYSLNVTIKNSTTDRGQETHVEKVETPCLLSKIERLFMRGKVILILLLIATVWNIGNLADVYRYKKQYESILFHTQYPFIEKTDQPHTLKVTIDNHVCLYTQATKTLDCP